MKKTRNLIKSAAEDDEDENLESQETLETGSQVEDDDSDQFEADEEMIDSISDAEEFAGTDISKEDIIDAIQAIDALADAVIEKSDAEEAIIDADTLLDEVEEMIDAPEGDEPMGVSEEDATFEMDEDEELPEELTNAAVKVMISEDGATTVESNPDSVYDSEIDGLGCTVYDTCDVPEFDVEDEGESNDDDLLVVGSSKATKFKKGFVVLKSNANKRCWSAAVKKVRKMVGSSKLTAAHWVIVSALANAMVKSEAEQKVIQSKVLNVIRNNKDMKARLNKIIKSDAEIDPAGQTDSDVKIEDEFKNDSSVVDEGDPAKETSPEEVDSTSGNPVEDPDLQSEKEGEYIDVPDAPIAELEIPLNNARYVVTLKRLSSSKRTGKTMYIVNGVKEGKGDKPAIRSAKEVPETNTKQMVAIKQALDGKVVNLKNGTGVAFKNTSQGLLACACAYEDAGKGNYTVCLKNNRFVITIGKPTAVFNNAEKVIIAQKIASARSEGYNEGRKEAERIYSAKIRQTERNAQKAIASAKRASNANEAELRRISAQKEREALFQSSQKQMNEEKQFIKESNTRNAESLDKLYKGMF